MIDIWERTSVNMSGNEGAKFVGGDRMDDSIELSDLLRKLLDHVVFIVIAAVLGAMLMAIVRGADMSVLYSSSVRMLLVSEGGEGLSAAIAQAEHMVWDYAELFQTSELHSRVAEQTQLGYTAGQLMEMTKTEILENTHILCATVSAPAAEEAERLAGAYAECFAQLAQERMNVAAPAVFEPPTKAVRAKPPVTAQNCVFGGLSGMAAACSVIVLAGVLDDRIRTPEDVLRFAGAEMLGVLTRQRRRKGRSSDAEGRKQAAFLAENLLMTAEGRTAFAVTSCRGGEGKSYVSLQLARALAQDGHSTVLVCADRGSAYPVKKNADADRTKGGRGPVDIACETDAANLYVIARENLLRGDSAKIRSEDMRALVTALTDEGCCVIVDSPSASRSVEAARIAGACGSAVVVAQYGRTRRGELAEAVRMLRKSGCASVGCAVNGVRFRSFTARKEYGFWYSASKCGKKKDFAGIRRKKYRIASGGAQGCGRKKKKH